MDIGLTTHFGATRDDALLEQLSQRGWQRCRIDAQNRSGEDAAEWSGDVLRFRMLPYVILNRPEPMGLLPGIADVEVVNEPNLNGPDPDVYVALAREFADRSEGRRLWGPTVSNLDKGGFVYLEAVVPRLPAEFGIVVHRYPRGPFAQDAHPPAKRREDEVAHLLRIIGNRPFGISESGFHQATQPKYGDWRKNLAGILPGYEVTMSDDQQKENLLIDGRFWKAHGAEFWDVFQVDDGPLEIPEHRFGIRRTDGTWKPSATLPQEL